ncbi:hypothetical protein XELAEV_18016643mg [Xenopus laevis]|uniref:Uncharacterized protein n=1 Tax=Xenopus laevis TaxID=8355 RepID=A0A974D9J9_XENLA|nr:hypothetical protein XELAEV_18016643mg [Xenopus laevis]
MPRSPCVCRGESDPTRQCYGGCWELRPSIKIPARNQHGDPPSISKYMPIRTSLATVSRWWKNKLQILPPGVGGKLGRRYDLQETNPITHYFAFHPDNF